MNNKNKIFTVWHLSLLILSVFILSCSESTPGVVKVSSVTIVGGNQTVGVGISKTLSVELVPKNADDNTLVWTSSDPKTASIDEKTGVLTPMKSGTVTITATVDGKTDTITLTVNIPVSSIQIIGGDQEVISGSTRTLGVNVFPANATNKTPSWESSDTTVATIGVDNGIVTTLVEEGTTTITASVDGVEDSITLTVTKEAVPVTSVAIDGGDLDAFVGTNNILTATVQGGRHGYGGDLDFQ